MGLSVKSVKLHFNIWDTFKHSQKASTTFIPERFERAVLKHIILNNTAIPTNNNQYPLLLGIQGPYGYGKTFMVKEVCKKYNINLKPLSTSELSGSIEGDSKKSLKRLYYDTCNEVQRSKHCAAILIDDFHLTIATEDTMGKTVNTNILASYMMNLCDNPIQADNRVPIILTGNNFRRVYPAIVRDGRMDIFTWSPTLEDIDPIVRSIFKTKFSGITDEVLSTMLELYGDMNIAFFEQVAQDLMNSSLTMTLEAFKKVDGAMSIAQLGDSVKEAFASIDLTEDNVLEVCQYRKAAVLLDFEKNNPSIRWG